MAHKFKPSYTSSIAEDIMAERLIRAKAVEFLLIAGHNAHDTVLVQIPGQIPHFQTAGREFLQ